MSHFSIESVSHFRRHFNGGAVSYTPSLRSTWLGRCLVASIGAVIVVLAFAIIIPLLAIAGVAAVARVTWLMAGSWWRRQRSPNGTFDGRRNVRVRRSEPDGE